jgi:hypothetical protein
MTRRISGHALALGGLSSLTAYLAMSALLDQALAWAPSEAAWLATYGLLHCAGMLVAIPTALGFMTGRIAGHDLKLNGALAALPVSAYALATLAFGDGACCGLVSVLPAALAIPYCTAMGAGFSARQLQPAVAPAE